MPQGIINPKGRINIDETSRIMTPIFWGETDESLKNWAKRLSTQPSTKRKKLVSRVNKMESGYHKFTIELLLDGHLKSTILKALFSKYGNSYSKKELKQIHYQSKQMLLKMASGEL